MSTSERDATLDAAYGVREGNPSTIERQIDSTRAEVRADLEALERRLSIDRLVDLTWGRVRERGGEFAGNLTDAATQNPMPLLLTSIGLGWLMLTSRSNGRYRPSYGDSSRGDSARHAADTAAAAASGIGERIHGAAESSREAFASAAESSREAWENATDSVRARADSMRARASEAAAGAREQADYARERMQRMLDEQPLMLGAFGLLAGAIIGAILPATEAENRLVGDVRDRTVDEAKRAGRERFEAVRETVRETVESYAAKSDEAETDRPSSRPH